MEVNWQSSVKVKSISRTKKRNRLVDPHNSQTYLWVLVVKAFGYFQCGFAFVVPSFHCLKNTFCQFELPLWAIQKRILPASLQPVMVSKINPAIEGGACASTTFIPVSQSNELSGNCLKTPPFKPSRAFSCCYNLPACSS